MDPDLGRFEVVWAAAGTATAVFPVPPATLRTLANAVVAPIAEDRPEQVAANRVAQANPVATGESAAGVGHGGPAAAQGAGA